MRGRIFLLLFLLSPITAAAQLQQGSIQGTLLGPDDRPVDAVVVLLDALGEPLATVTSASGRFTLPNIPPGTYSLRAEAPPLRALVPMLAVRDALPIALELRMSAVVEDQVVVRAEERSPATPTSGITLAGEALRRAPVRLRSHALQEAIASTPGWSTEDNGLLHVRGVDDGFLYVLDGVPVYERLDGLFGLAPDPAMIDSVNVITGHIPAEFGFKSGGVIEVRSAGRVADRWAASAEGGGGSDSLRDASVVAGGPVAGSAALTIGAGGQSSTRFLDPVHPENLHNEGGAFSGGVQFGWSASSASTVTLVTAFGRSLFDVPHGEEQEGAGQDQRQRLGNVSQTASWQRAWRSGVISQVAGYARSGSAALTGSEADTPVTTNADRAVRRIGALASITAERGVHLLKAGGEAARLALREEFSFGVTDPDLAEEAGLSEAALAFTGDAPFEFRDTAAPTLMSAYVQDSIRINDQFTLDLGLRADWSRLLVSSAQVSPRVGVAYHWPDADTTARASFGRYFQPPQPENLLLASSEAARELSPFADETDGGGADLLPERQTAFDVSVSRMLARRVRVEMGYWARRVREASDPNVFFGTTLVFPNSVARARASGVDVRVEVPRRDGWSGYVSYANAHVAQFGPITGGLFLEDDVIEIGPGTRFTPDHDQRHVGAFGLSYDHTRTGTSVAVSGRYESGTPLEAGDEALDELAERAGAELVDFERGRVRPRQVFDLSVAQRLRQGSRVGLDLRVAVLNITGERWAYNFGNPFSGTHFGHGRTLQLRLRASLR